MEKLSQGIWQQIALTLVAAAIGWWARQLTLEIPPQWFREDVQANTSRIGAIESRITQVEGSDRYAAVVERLIELERAGDARP